MSTPGDQNTLERDRSGPMSLGDTEFGKSPLERRHDVNRPPPLNLPPMTATNTSAPAAPAGGEDMSVIVSREGGGPSSASNARGSKPSTPKNNPLNNANFGGGTAVGVLEGQGIVMTVPIQNKQHKQQGSWIQHTLAALEMRIFASRLSMSDDATTKMGKRELNAVQQIADQLAADASRTEDKEVHGQHRPPLTLTSVNDCFRLFFGSNVTIFPFYASRLGSIGLVITTLIACVINAATMLCLHRARHNLVTIELHRRIDEHILDANGVTPRGSPRNSPSKKDTDDDLNLFIQRAAARANKEVNGTEGDVARTSASDTASVAVLPASNTTQTASDAVPSSTTGLEGDKEEHLMTTLEEFIGMQEEVSGGDVMPYFMGLSSLVKLATALWPNHWLRHLVIVSTIVSLFFGCCNFCLLMAKNLAPILGLEQLSTVVLCAVLLALMSMIMSPTTSTYLAFCSNFFIFGGGGLLLAASLGHEQTEEERTMPMQILPKTVVDIIIFGPSVLMFLSAPLVTLEVETIIAARIYPIIKNTFEMHRGTITPPITPTASGATTPRGGVTPKGSSGMPSSPPLSPTSNRNARAYNPSLVYVNIIQKYYAFVMQVGLALCVVILLVIAELILWSFKDNTNSVIALSLPESWIRTGILASLSVGLYACGALNFAPMCVILDNITNKMKGLQVPSIVKQAIGRAAFFTFVVVFLYLVPFFDLVAALSSTIRGSTLIFFIPPIIELQSEILRAATKSENRVFAQTATTFQRVAMGFSHMPSRSRLIFIMGMFLGMFVLFVSTYFVVLEAINRQKKA